MGSSSHLTRPEQRYCSRVRRKVHPNRSTKGMVRQQTDLIWPTDTTSKMAGQNLPATTQTLASQNIVLSRLFSPIVCIAEKRFAGRPMAVIPNHGGANNPYNRHCGSVL